jgi:hypothetical protein
MQYFRLAACLAAAAAPLLSGCSSSATDDPATASDEAALSALTASEIVGTIAPGQTSGLIPYASPPNYRALSFTASSGDVIDAWVRSTNGDSLAWIVTSSFKSIAFNDDGAATTKDSHLHAAVPGPGTYYVVFRERDHEPADFRVSLDVSCKTENEITKRDCGAGGFQERICLSNAPGTPNRWSEYGACQHELVDGCVAGAVETERCGNCGTRTMTCSASHTWSFGTCASTCTWSFFSATCEP